MSEKKKWSMKDRIAFLIAQHSDLKGAELVWKVLSRYLDWDNDKMSKMLREDYMENPNYLVRVSISIKERGWVKWHEAVWEEFPKTYSPKYISHSVISGIEDMFNKLQEEVVNKRLNDSSVENKHL